MRDFTVETKDSENDNKKNRFRSSNKKNAKSSCRDLLTTNEDDEVRYMKRRNDVELSEDEEFLLEEYESEDEGKSKRKARCDYVSSSSDGESDEVEFQNEEEDEDFKIYFCSRTHSQLSQFVGELRKTTFASEVKVVCLGSRKNFCISEDVIKLGSYSRINERCLELQKNKKSDVSKTKLAEVLSHLGNYLERFRNLLGAGNRRYIQTIMVLVQAFIRALLEEEHVTPTNPCQNSENPSNQRIFASSMAINNFLFSLNIDNINLVKLRQYTKVSGYGTKLISLQRDPAVVDGGNDSAAVCNSTGFRALVDILHSLANNDGDGRIIISKRTSNISVEEGYLKYVMLAGENIFSEIVNQAHAVVLAGGTLQPIEETRERLFPWLCRDQLFFFSCVRIVPPQSILPIVVSHGPSGKSFDFSYTSRSSPSTVSLCNILLIEELGRLLCNLVGVVPEGIVVFFSSFEFEGQVYDAWKLSGILQRIMKKKRIFREPRNSIDVELTLKEYKETILMTSSSHTEGLVHQGGAVLLAVVGGKISEGINFSDGMGCCVLMVGLPYASPSDIELIERIKHIEGLGDSPTTRITPVNFKPYNGESVQAGFDILRNCKRRGKEYYENLCMKAMNQSIGRAIRHLHDYAAILLVDSRYASDPVKWNSSHPTNKLPEWIKASLVSGTQNYGEVHKLLHQFFKEHKQRA